MGKKRIFVKVGKLFSCEDAKEESEKAPADLNLAWSIIGSFCFEQLWHGGILRESPTHQLASFFTESLMCKGCAWRQH